MNEREKFFLQCKGTVKEKGLKEDVNIEGHTSLLLALLQSRPTTWVYPSF